MIPTALVPIADNTEECEAITIIDVLRRGGIDVTVASVMSSDTVCCAHGTRIVADTRIGECVENTYTVIALPGGMPGAEHLRDSTELRDMLCAQKEAQRVYAAICASPAVVLAQHGLLDGVRATCYPSLSSSLPLYENKPVVIDGMCITGEGPGSAMAFALAIVSCVVGEDTATQLAKDMRVI